MKTPSYIDCPTCGGTGKDPKKRTRKCPNQFCLNGRIDIHGMCDCICHDPRHEILHIMDCCTYTYSKRNVFEKVLEAANDARRDGETD